MPCSLHECDLCPKAFRVSVLHHSSVCRFQLMGPINPCVTLASRDDIAVIVADNPPVNALSHPVRAGLLEAIRIAIADPALLGIVFACEGRTFFVGADITEFGKPAAEPSLAQLVETLEGSSKPTVAAIFGAAFGGGLELALACHFRVSTADAQLGLPEVRLGILPGAGGTQRLPRLIGPEEALSVIVSGTPIPAAAALSLGAIDAIVEDPVAGAVRFARKVLAEGKAPVRVRDREDKLRAARSDPSSFERAALRAIQNLAGMHAPAACVRSVRNAFLLPFEDALVIERESFESLVSGEQSAALRYLFFAERKATRPSGVPERPPYGRIREATIVGAGAVGHTLAMSLAEAGIGVTSVAAGETTDWSAVEHTPLVIDAGPEDLEIRKSALRLLDGKVEAGTWLALVSATANLDSLAAAASRPERVVGLHFAGPLNTTKLLEIVRGRKTSSQSIGAAVSLAKQLGKIAVLVGNGVGLVGARIQARLLSAAERLLLEGMHPQEVDAICLNFGFTIGPLVLADVIGLDEGRRTRQALGMAAPIADALCAAGCCGQKSSAGYYIYPSGPHVPAPNGWVVELAQDLAQSFCPPMRDTRAGQKLERLLYPAINEAARILEEGIVSRASDIDVVCVHGYGWPAWRGGPCFFADATGVANICDALRAQAASSTDATLEPSRLLRDIAAGGSKLVDLDGHAAAA